MSKHDDIHETPDVSYIHNEGTLHEHSDVNVGAIAKFAFGLFILTVFTFGLVKLMEWGFQYEAKRTATANNPMMQMTKDKDGNKIKDMNATLPPEPRLQLAPGFQYVKKSENGVVIDDPNKGKIDLSLGIPQAEWREFQKEYKEILEKGLKDEKGNFVIKPLEEVEKEVLQKGLPTRPQATEEMMKAAKEMPSSSSSGRTMEVRKQ